MRVLGWEVGPTRIEKCRLERMGRRSLDTGLEYETASGIANQEPRTAEPAVRATRFGHLGAFRNRIILHKVLEMGPTHGSSSR